MFKTVTREITLLIQSRSGLSTLAVASAVVILAALLVAFAFLCVPPMSGSQFSSVTCSLA